MSIGFPSAISKPSGLTALPSSAKRPAFGTLYGFDASGGSGGGGASGFNISTRETEATISASSPTNPTGEVTIAYGTDTEDLYIWDGVSWYTYNND
jgi:hypothetical protein